jgi:hypothetical protein
VLNVNDPLREQGREPVHDLPAQKEALALNQGGTLSSFGIGRIP